MAVINILTADTIMPFGVNKGVAIHLLEEHFVVIRKDEFPQGSGRSCRTTLPIKPEGLNFKSSSP